MRKYSTGENRTVDFFGGIGYCGGVVESRGQVV